MSLQLSAVVLDAKDMKRAIGFWTAALGYEVADASDSWTSLADPKRKGVEIGLQPNKDPKPDVNRVHIDLAADDVAREVARLLELGATRVEPWPYPAGAKYVVLVDTEGNEFCVVRG